MRKRTRTAGVWMSARVMVLALTGRPAHAQETPTDHEIRHELNALPRISVFDWLQWRYDKGTVTLSGSVWQPITKSDAENAVKRVSGVDFKVEIAPRREGDPAQIVADSQRARTALRWQPRFDDLSTIVGHALAWEQALIKRRGNAPQGGDPRAAASSARA